MPEINDSNLMDFCGWGRRDALTMNQRIVEAKREADEAAAKYAAPFAFKSNGIVASGAGKCSRLDTFVKKVTGKNPRIGPQATGDCFPAGTMVTMADGSERPIEQLRGGDVVLTHTGVPAKVLRLHQREYTGQMNTLRAANIGRSVTSTASHEFVHVSKSRKQDWKIASALTTKQFVLVPAMFRMQETVEVIEPNVIAATDLSTFWNAGTVASGSIQDPNAVRGRRQSMKYQLPEQVAVDEQFGRLIGLYLAEGGASDNKVQFSFGSDEQDTLVPETQSLLQSVFGLDSTLQVRHENRSCIVVQCHSTALVLFLKALVPGNVYSKQVPDLIMRAPLAVRLACLNGWLDGDGSVSSVNAKRVHARITGVTASPKLAETITRLALSCGIRPATRPRKHRADRAQAYDVCFNGDSAVAVMRNVATAVKKCRVQHGFALRVKSNDVSFVETKMVYCIEVDHPEHSFIANGYAVHNCVAMASKQAAVMRSCVEIVQGDAEQYRYLFAPFHYATSRVLVGKNRLKGGAGSVGGWVSEAMQTFGYLDEEVAKKAGLEYGKGIAEAWGDDLKFQGKSFRDFMGEAKQQSVRRWTQSTRWEDLRDALYHKHPFHICSDCGYTMKPDADGFHRPSGQWPHDMCIFAFWENVKVPSVGIINSWGDVHGKTYDPETGEELPPGTILVRLEDFNRRHLPGSECIGFSDLDGFDATIDWSQFG